MGDAGAGPKLAAVSMVEGGIIKAEHGRTQGPGVLLQQQEAALGDVVVQPGEGCRQVACRFRQVARNQDVEGPWGIPLGLVDVPGLQQCIQLVSRLPLPG